MSLESELRELIDTNMMDGTARRQLHRFANKLKSYVGTNNALRDEWRTAGGDIHGPIVETVSMPEAAYFEFRRRFINS
jgi:hypothetical protein